MYYRYGIRQRKWNLTCNWHFCSIFRGAQAAIVVYDITNQDTFGRAKVWVKELQRQASPNIVIAIAGNKADLAAKRAVEFEEAKSYAEENGLLFMESSAKTAMNVNDIFLAIGKYLKHWNHLLNHLVYLYFGQKLIYILTLI